VCVCRGRDRGRATGQRTCRGQPCGPGRHCFRSGGTVPAFAASRRTCRGAAAPSDASPPAFSGPALAPMRPHPPPPAVCTSLPQPLPRFPAAASSPTRRASPAPCCQSMCWSSCGRVACWRPCASLVPVGCAVAFWPELGLVARDGRALHSNPALLGWPLRVVTGVALGYRGHQMPSCAVCRPSHCRLPHPQALHALCTALRAAAARRPRRRPAGERGRRQQPAAHPERLH
jgi:hypothetical protein